MKRACFYLGLILASLAMWILVPRCLAGAARLVTSNAAHAAAVQER